MTVCGGVLRGVRMLFFFLHGGALMKAVSWLMAGRGTLDEAV